MRKFAYLLAAAAFMGTRASTAHAQNIVKDGGFELAAPGAASGDTTPFFAPGDLGDGVWFVTQNEVDVDTDNQYVFDGAQSADLTANSITNSLTQTLTTMPGQTYTISFYANANNRNDFSVTFGGASVTGAPTSIAQGRFPNLNPNGNAFRFTFYTGTATATSGFTDLTFSATDLSGITTVELDNVSVIANTVPEPSGLALLTATASVGLLLRRRKR